MMSELALIWQPFLLGSLVLAAGSAVAGNLLVRTLWRMHIIRYIKQKRHKRRKISVL
jgi:uncharacterized protein (DUF2062 family)